MTRTGDPDNDARPPLSRRGALQRFLEASSDLIFVSGFDGYFKELTPRWTLALDYTAEELMASPYLDFVHPDDQRATIREIARSGRKDIRIVNYRNRFRAKDGSYHVLLWAATPFADEGLIYGSARDITDLEIAQADSARFAAIVASSEDAIVSVSLDGRIMSWNAAAERIFGYTENEALGAPVRIIVPPDRAGEVTAMIARVRGGERADPFETVRVRRDGTPIDVLVTISPIKDVTRQIVGASAIVRDISDRTRIERELIQARDEAKARSDELKAVLDAATEVALIATGVDGVITTFNSGAETLLGYSAGEMIGTRTPTIIHLESELAEYGRQLSAEYRRPIQGVDVLVEKARHGLADSREWTYVRKDGSHVPVQLIVTASLDQQGNIVGFLGVAIDLSARKRAEAELAAKEEQVRLLLESTAEAIYTVDTSGTCTLCNPASLRMLGFTDAREFLGKHAHDLIHHSRADGSPIRAEDCPIVRAFQHGKEFHSDQEVFWRRDGTSFPVECWAHPIRRGGEFIGSVVTFIDITIRHRALSALGDSELKYRTLYESSRDAIMTLFPPGWTFTAGNRATIEMFGARDEADFIRHTPGEVSPDRQPDGELSAVKAARMIETAMREGSHYFEWTHKRIGGPEFPATVLLARVELDGRAGLQATVRDVSAQKQAEEALKASTKEFDDIRHALDLSAIVSINDGDGNIVYVNDKVCEISQYSRDELIGRNPRIFKSGQHSREFFGELWQTVLAGKRWHGEMCNKAKDGSLFWVDTTITPFLDPDGKPYQFVVIRHDITRRKRLEEELVKARDEALQASQAKARFLAAMSHEIRTPMNAIIGMTGLLLNTELTGHQKDLAETVRNSGDYLLSIINDILDFSKIEADKLRLEETNFDLRQVIESTVELMAVRAQEKRIDVGAIIPRGTPQFLVGDPGRLRQVLLNLVSNAVKFTDTGEVIVRADAVADDGASATLRLSVSDTGIGIPREAMGRLFESFTQADASTTRRFGGTGLGLAISKKLVGLMGGEIGVESEAGAGSTFWLTVRLRKGTAPPPLDGNQRDRLAAMRALIVGDIQVNRTILASQLDHLEMRHEAASSGPEALATLARAAGSPEAFGVVLIDMQKSGMDGLQTAAAIRSDPRLAGAKIVVLSSVGQVMGRAEMDERGISSFLTKPAKQSVLLQTLLGLVEPAAGAAPRSGADAGARPRAPRPFFRILVAEDNSVNQRVARMQLRSLGYEPDIVGNGQEVLDALGRIPYDLVLMDCQMPEMDGFEATRRLRTQEAGRRHTPVVAMTADAMDGDRERCLEAGMDGYVSKPVRLEDLEAAILPWDRDFDSAAIEKLKALAGPDDGGMIAEMVAEFLDSSARGIAALETAIAAGDATAVRQHAHAIKGAAGSVGALAMQRIAARLEALGRSGELEDAGRQVAALAEELARVRERLAEAAR